MKIVLIRHPETNKIAELPGDQEALSPRGVDELSKIVDRCQAAGVQVVFHSTLRRAAITASSIAASLQVPDIAQDGLEERNFGDWNEWEWSRIAAALDALDSEERYTFIPPNGESWQQMEERLRRVLSHVATGDYDVVAIVTHMGPIRALMPLLRHDPRTSTLQLLPETGQVFIETYEDAMQADQY